MKKILLFMLFPLLGMAQIQIGADIDGVATNDSSGCSVSLSSNGSVIAVGSRNNNATGVNTGCVRVYQNLSGFWSQIGADIKGNLVNEYSGTSVSISSNGTVVAIRSVGPGYSGRVKIYQNISGVWIQKGSDVVVEGMASRDSSSVSLSSDGSIVAIGTSREESSMYSGYVRIYQYLLGVWTQVGADINGEANGDKSGYSISLSSNGTVVAIGAPDNDGYGQQSGHVRVYQNLSGVWTQIGNDINGKAEGDGSGYSVSVSSDGSVVAIGAPNNDGSGANAGHVRVYQNLSGVWTQIGNDINGKAEGDGSGYSVSVSSDGSVVAIGAPNNDRNGTNAGHVRVYRNLSGTWTQIGADIGGEGSMDVSGGSVSISGDGLIVGIGATRASGNALYSGHVRVYNLSEILKSDNVISNEISVSYKSSVDEVGIKLLNDLEFEKAIVYNALGQVVCIANTTTFKIPTSGKGIYYLKVFTNKGNATKTILIK